MATSNGEQEDIIEEILRQAHLTDDVIQELLEVYGKFDKDGDGLVNHTDMKEVLESFGESPTEDRIRDLFEDADRNKDGMIDFGEFVVASIRGPWGVDEDSGLLGAMTRVNQRHQGKVTLEDLCRTLFHAGERLAAQHGLLSPQSSVEADENDGQEMTSL
ncbi:uncharacterized protein LOC135467677 isoform X2 [Liolophura sinensis]